jgi:hypothetical protein
MRHRPAGMTGRMARVIRAAGTALLIAATAGALPLTAHGLEGVRGCGDQCTSCSCKRRPVSLLGMRAPCPCCQPIPGIPNPMKGVGPAVVPRAAIVFVTPSSSSVPRYGAGRHASFSPPVPHPPPRTLPLA